MNLKIINKKSFFILGTFLLASFLFILISTSCEKEDDALETTVENDDGNDTFTCGDVFKDSRDSIIYQTVEIGNQCWMAENLRFLPSVRTPCQGSTTEPYFYVYGYMGSDVMQAKATDSYQTFGVLYNWTAAMGGVPSVNAIPSGVQGICPEGWHIPSDAEWEEMDAYLIANGYNYDDSTTENLYAAALASDTLWEPSTTPGSPGYNLSDNNMSGFVALPASSRGCSGHFGAAGMITYFWSTTEFSDNNAYGRSLTSVHAKVFDNHHSKSLGLSVRCIKD